MEKVLRDDCNFLVGFADTPKPRGEYTEFCSPGRYTKWLTVAETLNSADIDTYHGALEMGKWS